MKEADIRKQVKALSEFYRDVLIYALVNGLLFFIWLVFNRTGEFWPKYIILIWGIMLIFKAYRKDLFPIFLQHLSFLTPEWEEKKVDELMENYYQQRKIHLTHKTRGKASKV